MASEEILVDSILEGKSLRDENGIISHFDITYRKFCDNALDGDAEKLNIHGKSELFRVLNLKEFFEWIPVPQSYFKRFEKASTTSAIFRDRGNKAYLADNYEKALRCYNLAIGFSPPGEPELGLAYEKRADLLLTLNEPDFAQRDINLAAVSAYPKKAAQKLIELQHRCAIIANRKNVSVQNSNKGIRIHEARRFCHDKFFKLKTPHPQIQNVEEFVEIDYRSECGRRVIVSRDVPAGTVMLLDSPYAFNLTNLLKYDTEHCHHCSLPIIAGIPCDSCTFAWFCSDSCLAKASNGVHKSEHKYLPYLLCHPMASRIITTARVLLTSGSESIFNLYQSKDPLYFSPKSGATRGFNEEGVYEVNSYLPIYHLISHPPSNFLKDISDVFNAILMTSLIDQTTQFFRKPRYTDQCTEADFKDFVASLFLRHMRSFEFNAITLSKLKPEISPDVNNNPTNTDPSPNFMKTIRYGAAVYPVLCLLNHSCDPNAVPVRSLKFGKTSVVAIKNLHRGDEIFISYTPSFTTHDCQERIKYLHERYNFYCNCDACNHNWSLSSRTDQFGESFCDRCHRYLLTGQCPPCATRDKQMPKLIAKLCQEAEHAEGLIQKNDFKEAEQLLVHCLEKCGGFGFSPCFGLYIDLQLLYKRALVGLFNQ